MAAAPGSCGAETLLGTDMPPALARRYIRSERSVILINFCLSIISSNALILIGQTQTRNKVSGLRCAWGWPSAVMGRLHGRAWALGHLRRGQSPICSGCGAPRLSLEGLSPGQEWGLGVWSLQWDWFCEMARSSSSTLAQRRSQAPRACLCLVVWSWGHQRMSGWAPAASEASASGWGS